MKRPLRRDEWPVSVRQSRAMSLSTIMSPAVPLLAALVPHDYCGTLQEI